MAPEVGEDASSMARRYPRNAVAWIHVIRYIGNHLMFSSSFKNVSLDLIATPLASPDTCASEWLLVDSAIKSMLKKLGLEHESEKATSLIKEFETKVKLPIKFHGTVHCGASLMGMVVAYQDNVTPLPDGVQREELELFKVV